MTYATDQLKQSLNQVLMESESRHYTMESQTLTMESRLRVLEEFMKKAQPYIDTLVLIDPPAKPE